MRTILCLALLGVGALAVVGPLALSQPSRPGGPPPRPELGSLLPPFVSERVTLTAEQQKQIRELEQEVKGRLLKILTPEQVKEAQEAFRQGPPGRGPGGPPPKGPPPEGPPGGPPEEREQASAGGIQWFATLEGGLSEAARTGKPILFVSAAPHCGGVPGIW